jgi:hypothetical protein
MASWFEGVSILRSWKTGNKTLWLAPFGTLAKETEADVRVRRISPSHVTFVYKLSEETIDIELAGAQFEVTDEAPVEVQVEEVPIGQFTRFLRILCPDGSVAVIGEYSV